MKLVLVAALSFVCLAAAAAADILTDWAFHAAQGQSPAARQVPGETFAFLSNNPDQIPDGEAVVLHVLTARNFAGDLDEQLYVRWWDGSMSHWVMGTWVKNLELEPTWPETRAGDPPADGAVTVDLWRIEIPSWITQPGENFYVIQLKGYAEGVSVERYLLRQPGGDFSQVNNLGQVWSASEEFAGQDWRVKILPENQP